MPVDLKTNVANAAVAQRRIDPGAAQQIEKMAEATKAMDASNKALGFDADAYQTTVSSPAYQRLSAAERDLFSHVYAEVMGRASGAFGVLGGKPTPARVEGAYHEVGDVLQRMQGLARRHGPGVEHFAPNDPSFKLADHPEKILRYAYRIKADTQNDPHVLVTFKADSLEAQRTHFQISQGDLTAQNFVDALRGALGDAFKDVKLMAVHEDGGLAATSPAAGAQPAAPAESRADKFKRLATELMKDVDNIPVLAGRVQEAHMHTAELVPGLAVRLSLGGGAAFDAVKPEAEKAIAAWMDAHGFSDLVSRNYLGNSIFVVARDGGLGL